MTPSASRSSTLASICSRGRWDNSTLNPENPKPEGCRAGPAPGETGYEPGMVAENQPAVWPGKGRRKERKKEGKAPAWCLASLVASTDRGAPTACPLRCCSLLLPLAVLSPDHVGNATTTAPPPTPTRPTHPPTQHPPSEPTCASPHLTSHHHLPSPHPASPPSPCPQGPGSQTRGLARSP